MVGMADSAVLREKRECSVQLKRHLVIATCCKKSGSMACS